MLGTCISYDRTKGFGHILPEDSLFPDVFCHYKEIQKTSVWRRAFLLPGMHVEFDVAYEPEDVEQDRPRATKVRVLAPITIAIQRSGPSTKSRASGEGVQC